MTEVAIARDYTRLEASEHYIFIKIILKLSKK